MGDAGGATGFLATVAGPVATVGGNPYVVANIDDEVLGPLARGCDRLRTFTSLIVTIPCLGLLTEGTGAAYVIDSGVTFMGGPLELGLRRALSEPL
jgi:hypothetical protein